MTPIQRSIFFSAIERYAGVLLSFLATAILSRLLTPGEFGTYAVVGALTAVIAAAFQEFGGANYLIQKRDLTHQSIRTAFTITFAICALVSISLCLLAGPAADYFGQEGLRTGIAVSALNFLIAPFTGTVVALCRRKMEFGVLAICNLTVAVASSLVTIVLALLNFSYMAPIWGNLVGNAILMAVLLYWYRDMTAFRPSLVGHRDVVSFGLYSSAVSVINVFYNFAPQLFLARVLDFASVGLYSRAVNITQLFDKLIVQVLNPVVMPAMLARRDAGDDLKGIYLDALQMLSVVQWPAMLFVAIMARPIILLWLGQDWLEIVPLVRLLCVANLALFAACLSYPLLVAVGQVRDALTSSLVSLPPSLLLILCASFFGVEAVAASALLTLPFQAAVAIYYIGGHLNLRLADVVRALAKSAIVTVLTAVGVAACAALVETGLAGAFLGVVLACFAAAICWVFGMVVTAHPLLQRLSHAASGFAMAASRLVPSRYRVQRGPLSGDTGAS